MIMDCNIISSIKNILRILRIQQTNTFLREDFLAYPDHPILISVPGALFKYNPITLPVKMDQT